MRDRVPSEIKEAMAMRRQKQQYLSLVRSGVSRGASKIVEASAGDLYELDRT